jgi:hypothetical protein
VVGLDQPCNITTNKRSLIELQHLRSSPRPGILISHEMIVASFMIVDRRSMIRRYLWDGTRPVRSVVGQITLSFESATRKKHT